MAMIWLDVSSILTWKRAAVGIIRVEAECALYALTLAREDLAFCRLTADRQFVNVSEAEVRSALDRITGGSGAFHDTPAIPDPIVLVKETQEERLASVKDFSENRHHPSWFTALKFLSKAMPRTLRATLRDKAQDQYPNFFLDKGLESNHESSHEMPLTVSNFADIEHGITPILFEKDDVYLSMGGDWNHGNLDYLCRLKERQRFRAVLFCYDTIPILFPHLTLEWVAQVFPHYFENMAYCAEHILCISENSRKDLKRYLSKIGAPLPPMSIVNLGCQINLLHDQALAKSVQEVLEKPFILFVSTIERRKNHETLYRAYAHLIDAGETHLPQLVFVGGAGWGVDDFLNDLRLDPRVKNHICIISDASDADLAALYKNAYFTLYPSLYEGWGLPVAESLAHGKFCLVSDNSSLPEVGGNFVEYLNAWDVPSWASRINWYCKNPQALRDKEAAILVNYQATSWQDSSASILNSAEDLLRS